MYKKYNFLIPPYYIDKIFKPIRNKEDIVKLILYTIEVISNQKDFKPTKEDSKLYIYIDDMHRVIYESSKKYFSINLPLKIVKNQEDNFEFYLNNTDKKIESFLLSCVTWLLERNILKNTIVDIFDIYTEDLTNTYTEDIFNESWIFIQELLLSECGYLRFDHDPDHADEKYHPKNHIDFYYSNSTTFKLGLKSHICNETFLKILNNKEERMYINID
ncbi:MAG: hypothetical protein ACRC4T_19655 [Cetobacterium sp.]